MSTTVDHMPLHLYGDHMEHTTIAKVTASGQVSLPASVRRRWKTAKVAIADEGDRVVVRPLPDAPIAAACGSLTRRGPTEKIRTAERRAGAMRERQRASQ
jgi:bifunctional DNA-binding transcriptional regulator/antitoxin component of YhaV-PrlF toxin-antitoxin module